jgi:sugar-phosphatase
VSRSLLDDADAILVDLDGTLVDSEAPVRRVWAAFAERHELDPEAVHAFAQGRPSRETIALLVPDAEQSTEAAALERAEVDDTDGVIALPGAADLLRIRRPLAIVTSCSTALAHARLAAAGLPVPSVLVSSDGLQRGKPDPECFLLAAAQLDVDPRRCVALEDSPAGVAAARAAGARVIALRTTHSDEQLGQAHVIVDHLAAIVAPLP